MTILINRLKKLVKAKYVYHGLPASPSEEEDDTSFVLDWASSK